MDTPSALTDDFASEVEFDFTSPDQQLQSFFPDLGPTEYLDSNLDSNRFVDEISSPEPGFVDPSFTVNINPLDKVMYNTGASRNLHGRTYESSGPRQGASGTSPSTSPHSQANTEQQHSDGAAAEGQADAVQSIEGDPTSSEHSIHNPHDLIGLHHGATEQSLNQYMPMVHSNPETPRLPSNSSLQYNSPMLSRGYSQHSSEQLATGSGSLGRQQRRTISHPTEYTNDVGVSSLHENSGQAYTQPPMPHVARFQPGGIQALLSNPRAVLGSSPMALATDLSSINRRPTPDYSHRYGQDVSTPRYSDFQQLNSMGHPTRPSYPSLEATSQSNRLSYGVQATGDYGSPSHRPYQQQTYNSSRGQIYQTNSMSGNDDRASSSPYLGHTARSHNPRQSLLQGVGMTEQSVIKYEDGGDLHSHKLTQYANLDEARRNNVPGGAPGPVPDDPTIPESDLEKQKIVLKIMAALNDMSEAQDNGGMKSTWRSLLVNQGQLEHVAWQILERCILRHKQKGALTTNSKPNHHYEDFDKRMVDILQGLRTQKTMCKHLMVAPYIDSLIDNPGYAASRIVNNRKVNLGKKLVTDKARAVLGQKTQGKGRRMLSVKEDETNDEDGDYDEDDDVALTAFDGLDTDSNRLTPMRQRVKTTRSPAKTSRKRKATSEDDSLDPSFPTPAKKVKKAPRASQSMYRTEGNFEFAASAVPSQQPYGMATSSTHQQGLGQRGSGGFLDRHGDEGFYDLGNSGEGDPSQRPLSAEDEAIIQQLLQAQQTNDLRNPGDLLAEGTFVQGGKIVRRNPATGATEILYDDFLLSPQYSQFSPFFPSSVQNAYAPTMGLQTGGTAFGTRSTARSRRATGRNTEQNTQLARQPPYGYSAVAPDDEAASALQKAPASRKRSRR